MKDSRPVCRPPPSSSSRHRRQRLRELSKACGKAVLRAARKTELLPLRRLATLQRLLPERRLPKREPRHPSGPRRQATIRGRILLAMSPPSPTTTIRLAPILRGQRPHPTPNLWPIPWRSSGNGAAMKRPPGTPPRMHRTSTVEARGPTPLAVPRRVEQEAPKSRQSQRAHQQHPSVVALI